jgi:hypothetical protein
VAWFDETHHILAVGSHRRGLGCVMNDISRWNGDTVVTDRPSCTHPILASVAQQCNDTICTHTDSGQFLCAECSKRILGYKTTLSHTPPPEDPIAAKRLAVTMALSTRRIFKPKQTDVSAAYDAAQGWLDGVVTADECKTIAFAAADYDGPGAYAAWIAALDYDELEAANINRAVTRRWFREGEPILSVLDTMIESYQNNMS